MYYSTVYDYYWTHCFLQGVHILQVPEQQVQNILYISEDNSAIFLG